MGLALSDHAPRAKRLLAIVSDTLALDVPRLLTSGGKLLSRTEVLQPVLVAVGLGAAYALEDAVGLPMLAMGHSLGELTAALYARGTSDEAAIEIAKVRGEAMAEAARAHPGGMVATDGNPKARARATELGLDLAAENAVDEVVFAGAIDGCRTLTLEAGAQPLRVFGPWHALSMASAGPKLAQALQGRLGERRCAFVTATTGRLENDADAIAAALVAGLTSPVRFTRALSAARGATDHFAVPCPGRLMRSLVRRNLDLAALLLDDVADLDVATRTLR